ncbi:MAG: response regulator [Elusimicrobiota bacterium]
MKNILVVEDNKTTLKMIEVFLQEEGYNVRTAENGKKAFILTKEKRPDLIILDIIMPEEDGYSFLETLRKEVDLKTIPVIISSTKERMEEFFELEELQPDEFLPKPYMLSELLDKVREFV